MLNSVSSVISDTEPVMAVKKENAASSMIMIKLEGHVTDMELDTGAAVSLISRELNEAKLVRNPLRKTDDMENYFNQREC